MDTNLLLVLAATLPTECRPKILPAPLTGGLDEALVELVPADVVGHYQEDDHCRHSDAPNPKDEDSWDVRQLVQSWGNGTDGLSPIILGGT